MPSRWDKYEKPLQRKERGLKSREAFKAWKATLSCVHCGENESCALDFHHLDPSEKEYNIGMMATQYSMESVLKEAAKCIVLCANCHRKLHAGVLKVSLQPSKLTS